jgi:hypothetical protein
MGFLFRARMGKGFSGPLLPQGAESCYLAHSLLKFYLNTVFKNYHSKIAKFKVLRSFSTLANNFIVIMSQLQPSVSRPWVEAGVCVLGNLPSIYPVLASFPDKESWMSWAKVIQVQVCVYPDQIGNPCKGTQLLWASVFVIYKVGGDISTCRGCCEES